MYLYSRRFVHVIGNQVVRENKQNTRTEHSEVILYNDEMLLN